VRRRLPILGLTISLLLLVAASAMWIRSHWRYDAGGFWPDLAKRRVYGVISNAGTCCVASLDEGGNGQTRFAYKSSAATREKFPSRAGFVYQRTTGGLIVGAPYWALVLLAGLTSAASGRSVLKRRRQRLVEGRCPTCGYDLRATPDRCPECGTAAKT
jgi:hypothetical protein